MHLRGLYASVYLRMAVPCRGKRVPPHNSQQMEIAVIGSDIQEVIGSAIAMVGSPTRFFNPPLHVHICLHTYARTLTNIPETVVRAATVGWMPNHRSRHVHLPCRALLRRQVLMPHTPSKLKSSRGSQTANVPEWETVVSDVVARKSQELDWYFDTAR